MNDRPALRRGDTWLTVADAALRVHRSKATIRRWATRGLITIRLGRIDERELLEAQRVIHAATRERTGAALQVRGEVRTLGPTIPPARPEPKHRPRPGPDAIYWTHAARPPGGITYSECCHPNCEAAPWPQAPMPLCERHYVLVVRHYLRLAACAGSSPLSPSRD